MFKCLLLLLTLPFLLQGALLENLRQARKGDYIVTVQGKNTTLIHVYDRNDPVLTLEEITAPTKDLPCPTVWKSWIMHKAPRHTAWVMYSINLTDGKMLAHYSLTKNVMQDMSQANTFLTTLLNLHLEPIPDRQRKKVGRSHKLWQPRMVVDGREIPDVAFDAYRTQWPKDKSELSGKTIEVYIPTNSKNYPSYFPYWLEISGLALQAKIRIIDSGSGMQSPAPPLKG